MTLVQLFLLATGGISLAVGAANLLWPADVAKLVDLSLTSPLAVIEVQGFYGGQLVGIGIAILLGVWNRRFVAPALVLLAATLGGTALGRLYGVVTGGSCPPIMAGLMVVEAGAAIVAGIFLGRSERA
jgi:hypothetical protein